MINNREKGKLSLSLKKGKILGRTDTTITGREGIIPSSKDQVTIRWSELYSENSYIKSWKRLRTNTSSNGPIRWYETQKSETEISIINTIKTMVTLPRIAEVYGIIWTNSSEKANWNSCCITLVVWVVRPIIGRKWRILHDPLSELSTLFLRCLAEQGRALLE